MSWGIRRPDDKCPVGEVLPMNGDKVQAGHKIGLGCMCQPCLTEDDDLSVLVHHWLVEGKPTRCTECGAHKCSLEEK